MNRLFFCTLLVPVVAVMFSCKKERAPLPAFSPAGYWTGSLSVSVGISIMTQPDGGSRLYVLPTSQDTLHATAVYAGSYTLTATSFEADYRIIDSNSYNHIHLSGDCLTASSISGLFVQEGSADANHYSSAYIFNVTKQ